MAFCFARGQSQSPRRGSVTSVGPIPAVAMFMLAPTSSRARLLVVCYVDRKNKSARTCGRNVAMAAPSFLVLLIQAGGLGRFKRCHTRRARLASTVKVSISSSLSITVRGQASVVGIKTEFQLPFCAPYRQSSSRPLSMASNIPTSELQMEPLEADAAS
jgi:hypothetical protein